MQLVGVTYVIGISVIVILILVLIYCTRNDNKRQPKRPVNVDGIATARTFDGSYTPGEFGSSKGGFPVSGHEPEEPEYRRDHNF